MEQELDKILCSQCKQPTDTPFGLCNKCREHKTNPNSKQPDKQEIIRDKKGKFIQGVSGNLKGRPKGKTIKELVREWLEEHPDDMKAFVEHFVKKNKELAWQMLEGRPPQDITSGGEKINPIPILDVSKNPSNNKNTGDVQESENSSGGDECQ